MICCPHKMNLIQTDAQEEQYLEQVKTLISNFFVEKIIPLNHTSGCPHKMNRLQIGAQEEQCLDQGHASISFLFTLFRMIIIGFKLQNLKTSN